MSVASPPAKPFRSIQRVYFDDLDALNILHNVRYLIFFERARSELFVSLGFNWHDDTAKNPDKWHVVAAHEIEYRVPISELGEKLIEVTPKKLGSSSLLIHVTMKSPDEKIEYAHGTSRLVRLDPTTNKPCPWSPRLREAMKPWLGDTTLAAPSA